MNDDNNDPATKNAPARTEESSTKSGGSAGSDSQEESPAPGLTTGDPVRREFTDKRDDGSRKTDSSRSSDKGAKEGHPRTGGQADDDAGEGHKGPRADATRAPSDNRSGNENRGNENRSGNERSGSSNPSSQQSRPNQSNQPNQSNPQKAAQPNAPAKSATDSGSVNKQDAKPARNQDGGAAGI